VSLEMPTSLKRDSNINPCNTYPRT
jgi:hypothetical protein